MICVCGLTKKTEYGDNMKHYNKLLDTVISHITRSHTKTQSQILKSGSPRDTKTHTSIQST